MTTKEAKKNRTSKDSMPGSRSVSKLNKFRSFCFYGRSGTGKTTLASTFPGDIILLDVRDEGTDSISDVAGVDVREIEDHDDMEEAYWWLKKNTGRYKTVVIDTVSQWQQLVVEEIAKSSKKKGKDKAAGDWGSMSQRAWGDVATRMKTWIINFRDLTKDGYNVVFIAQDRVFNAGDDEDSSDDQISPEVGPALSPAIKGVLNAAVSVIGNTFVAAYTVKKEVNGKKVSKEKIEYRLRVGPSSVYTTKVRKPRGTKAPPFISDPTYEDIMEIITGE